MEKQREQFYGGGGVSPQHEELCERVTVLGGVRTAGREGEGQEHPEPRRYLEVDSTAHSPSQGPMIKSHGVGNGDLLRLPPFPCWAHTCVCPCCPPQACHMEMQRGMLLHLEGLAGSS